MKTLFRFYTFQLLFIFSVSIVTRYTKQGNVINTHNEIERVPFEHFVDGLCKEGVTDLTIYDKGYDQCVQECRSRTLCKSINVYSRRVKVCRLNFESDLEISKCPLYIHSVRANWKKKSEDGCEALNCSITQKCVRLRGNHVCVTTECRNVHTITNGIVLGNHVDFGKKRAFRCNHGYRLLGQSSITCQNDGSCETTESTTIMPSASTTMIHEATTSTPIAPSNTQQITNGTNSSIKPTTASTTKVTTSRQKTSATLTTTKSTRQHSSDTTTATTTIPVPMTSTATQSTTVELEREFTGTATTGYQSASRNCIFGQFYDPRTVTCVDVCLDGRFGPTYQSYQDYKIRDAGKYHFERGDAESDPQECLDRCNELDQCSFVVVTTVNSDSIPKHSFDCFYYNLTRFTGDDRQNRNLVTYVRDCQGQETGLTSGDSSTHTPATDVTLPINTRQICLIGTVYSHTTELCTDSCKQVAVTFQKYQNVMLSQEFIGTVLTIIHEEATSMIHVCLEKCTTNDACNTVAVTKRDAQGDMWCNFFHLELIPAKLWASIDNEVYFRDCL